MKKITSVIIAAILCIGCAYALMSCGGTTPETTTAAETKAQETTTAAEQTDAATTAAETQAETTAEATTAEATTAEATKAETASQDVNWFEDEKMLFERRDGDNHDPIAADNGIELACKFTIPDGARLTGLLFESCPTWSTLDSS